VHVIQHQGEPGGVKPFSFVTVPPG
jgi:hypothetical protein